MHTLDRPFRDLTRAAFARYGFAYGELLAQWPAIVGDGIAQWCTLERIKWPRRAGEIEQKRGGTLILRAAPGRALDLQHEGPRIIERINAFYGYSAIAEIKIRQGLAPASTRDKPIRKLDPKCAGELEKRLETVGDPSLREALGRLGSGVLARSASRPHNR